MNRPAAGTFHFWSIALFAALALIASPALAAHTFTIVDQAEYDDEDDDIGVDLAFGDEGLQIVLTREGRGALGDIAWPESIKAEDRPEDALDRPIRAEALKHLAILNHNSTGVVFVINGSTRNETMGATGQRLQAIGCSIGDLYGPASFAFECGGEPMRAVFGTTADGIRVFLGQ